MVGCIKGAGSEAMKASVGGRDDPVVAVADCETEEVVEGVDIGAEAGLEADGANSVTPTAGFDVSTRTSRGSRGGGRGAASSRFFLAAINAAAAGLTGRSRPVPTTLPDTFMFIVEFPLADPNSCDEGGVLGALVGGCLLAFL